MARVNHKLVKQRLNEKRSKITDRQFFSSRLFAGHLEDLAAAQTRRYGELVYRKGETLEEFLAEYGIPDSWKYPISIHDIFHDEMNINKYSCTYNDETGKSEHIDWRRTIDEFIDDSDDDIVFVGIDYHI